jgi:hypothetical protein
MNIFRRLFDSPTLMTWCSYLIQFGTAIFLLPAVLFYFEPAEISIWFLFYIVLGMSVLADFGFGPTVIRVMSYFYAGADRIPDSIEEFKCSKVHSGVPNYQRMNDFISTFNSLYLLLGVGGALISLVGGYFLVQNAVSLLENETNIWLAFFVIVVRTFFAIQQVKWSSILAGLDKVALLKRVELSVNFFKLNLMLALILLDFKMLELMLVELIASIVLVISFRFMVLKCFAKQNHPVSSKFSFDLDILKIVWPPTWRLGAIQLGGYFINNGASFIIAQLKSPELIASFLLTQRVISFGRQICQAPLYANLPRVFQLMAANKISEIKIFCGKTIRLCITLLFTGMLLLIFLGNDILSVLGIEHLFVDRTILIVMSIAVVLEMHHSIHSQIYMGTNKVPFLIPSLYSALTIFIVSYFVVTDYGILGVVLTQLVVQLTINNWYPVYLNLGLLNWKFSTYLKDLFVPFYRKNIDLKSSIIVKNNNEKN